MKQIIQKKMAPYKACTLCREGDHFLLAEVAHSPILGSILF